MRRAGRGRELGAEMDAQRVLDLLADFADRDISVWLDGGWAVDALLGTQRRLHDDLDLVARREDTARIIDAPGPGYAVSERYGLPLPEFARAPRPAPPGSA